MSAVGGPCQGRIRPPLHSQKRLVPRGQNAAGGRGGAGLAHPSRILAERIQQAAPVTFRSRSHGALACLSMKSLEEYLELAAQNHGHMCPGQVLGVRMAMLGLKELGIDDPAKHEKRLLTLVEIDRCATDAVSLVTGCRLGKRSLKYLDYGKVAATFVDLETKQAVRVAARDEARAIAKTMFREPSSGGASDHYRQQLKAYQVMEEEDLF